MRVRNLASLHGKSPFYSCIFKKITFYKMDLFYKLINSMFWKIHRVLGICSKKKIKEKKNDIL